MKVNDELLQALEYARTALAQNEHGDLPLSARKRIWSAMGPRRTTDGRAILSAGLRRRTRLAILTAQKVISIWRLSFPENNQPEFMLATTEEYMKGQADYKTAWKRQNQFWGELDNLKAYAVKYSPSVNVGYAAAVVVSTALNDEQFDPQQLESDVSDRDLDVYDWDASYLACAAYAGGASWQPESDDNRRREFWEWYINEAVPSAWNSEA